jgi:hypothetical protein
MWEAGRQAGREVGGQARRQAGGRAGGQAGRQERNTPEGLKVNQILRKCQAHAHRSCCNARNVPLANAHKRRQCIQVDQLVSECQVHTQGQLTPSADELLPLLVLTTTKASLTQL